VSVDVDLRVDEALSLTLDGLDHVGVAVPRGDDGDAGREVEVLRPVDGRHPTAVARLDLKVGHLEPDLGQVRRRRHAGAA